MSDTKELSWEALAIRLGVTRQSVVNWRLLDGAPTTWDEAAWGAFIKEKGLGVKGAKVGSALKDEKTRHEIELLKAKLDREHRKVIDAEEVNRLLMHIGVDFKTELYRLMESELAPKLDGMSAVQMRPILREAADGILERCSGTIERFYNDK